MSKNIFILKNREENAEITPLHMAIKNRHLSLVKFIIENMYIDIRMSLTLQISFETYKGVIERLFPNHIDVNSSDYNGNCLIKEKKGYQDLSEEC